MTGYGLRYYATFDSFKGALDSYRLDIFLKGYDYPANPAQELLFSANPVVQEWQDDDPKQPIRGCTLDCKFITKTTGVHLSDFYSEDDLQFYCEFRITNTDQLLFAGFLMQDDCAEIQVDFNHEIRLLFTDMLGTLKDVTLDQAAVIAGTWHTETGVLFQDYSPVANNTIQSYDSRVGVLKNGDVFNIVYGGNTYTYTCYNITYGTLLGYLINIGQTPDIPNTPVSCDFIYKIPYPLDGYVPLIDILKLCLQSTYLQLQLRSFVNIYPITDPHIELEEIWQNTFVTARDYFDGTNWNDCYTILENIMSRFTCSLMQIDGTWVIIRWPEIYKYTKTNGVKFRGHYFDWDFTYIGLTSFESDFTFANGTDMETGVVRSIERPKLYSQETFNYSQNEMLKNANLQELGPLITEYVDANNDLIKEYQLLYWQDGMLNPPIFDPLITLTRFLRIAYYNDPLQNNFGEEKYRFIVITGGGAGSIYTSAATSNDIYLSKGDAFDYSFFISSGYGLSGYAELPMTILFQGVNNNYFYDLWGHWTLYPGYSPLLPFQKIYIQNGEDLVNGLVKELNVLPVPEDGILRLPLVAYPQNGPSDETYFKDFSFSIRSYYEGGSKINGQVHKDFQSKVIKNREEKDIYLDNSPSWYIKGTLYLGTTNVLRDKCKKWTYPGISYPYNSLGIATTQEELYQNYTPRAKYEGNLLYTKIGSGPYQFVNPLSVFQKIGEFQFYKFVPGKVTIDYKNTSVDLTLYEIISNISGFDDGGNVFEYLAWASKTYYEFKYLYDK